MFDITIIDAYAFLIIFMCAFILYGLWKINKIYKSPDIVALYFIPICFLVLYIWIGFYSPLSEESRPWVRTALFFSFGDAIAILIGVMRKIKGKGGK